MAYSASLVQAVWEKARGMPDRDGNEWRTDQCGAWLHRNQYGHPKAEFGWKIVNTVPGGPDELDNLQPLHWQNHFDVENGKAQCQVAADRTGLAPGQQVDHPRNSAV